MATDVLRPALGDVLCALTGSDVPRREGVLDRICSDRWEWLIDPIPTRKKRARVESFRGWQSGSHMWITTDPREALEILQTRGIAPEDDVRRGFACPCDMPPACSWCDGLGRLQRPRAIPDLVAWASLGTAAILRAEELAREAVVRLRPWGVPQVERVVWRVGKRRATMTFAGDEWQPMFAAVDLWDMGLALDSITRDAITLVVPPIGGAS